MMIKLMQVICAEITKGKGTEENPVRIVIQYWSVDGELLAEVDPFQGNTDV